MTFRHYIAPVTRDVLLKRGANWTPAFKLRYKGEPVSLDGMRARFVLRDVAAASDALVLTTENGRIELEPADSVSGDPQIGLVQFAVSSADSAALSPSNTELDLVGDLQLIDDTLAPQFVSIPISLRVKVLPSYL